MRNNEQGRSMIEMLGVLAIVGLLSMAGISLYTKALYQRKIANTIDQVSEVMANVRNAYRSRREFNLPGHYDRCTGANENSCDKRGLIPDGMINDDGSLRHALGGSVNLAQVGGEKAFTITIKGIDRHACTRITTSDWGKNVWIKACQLADDGDDNCGDGTERVVPMEKAASECSHKSNNAITWKVK